MVKTEVSDIDAVFDLITAPSVFERSPVDVGDKEALEFLDVCCPDWRLLVNRAGAGQHGKPLF